MPDQLIEHIASTQLTGIARENALDFISYLQAHGMLFERGQGYWADKYYWFVKYMGELVCFILIGGAEAQCAPWTIWSDDSDSNWFESHPLNERMRPIAWANVDICGHCGGCGSPGGRCKTIFGRAFEHVCVTPMRFIDPDAQTLECVKELMAIRKNDIQKNA